MGDVRYNDVYAVRPGNRRVRHVTVVYRLFDKEDAALGCESHHQMLRTLIDESPPKM
jgi:hypothetical protein